MFIVSEFEEVVKVQPTHLNDDQVSRIVIHLNSMLANKVVMDVGLCLSLFDILEIGDSIIYPGEGAYFSKVRFRFVVFRYVLYPTLFHVFKMILMIYCKICIIYFYL